MASRSEEIRRTFVYGSVGTLENTLVSFLSECPAEEAHIMIHRLNELFSSVDRVIEERVDDDGNIR